MVLAVLLVVASGVLGVTFIAWPTSISDQPIAVTPTMLAELASLKQERKFTPDTKQFYFGAPNEKARAEYQAAVDVMIESLILELPRAPRSSLVLGIFKQALASFTSQESEEKDQFLVYLQRIMQIVGLSSTHELFNVWRYGFPYGWLIRS